MACFVRLVNSAREDVLGVDVSVSGKVGCSGSRGVGPRDAQPTERPSKMRWEGCDRDQPLQR